VQYSYVLFTYIKLFFTILTTMTTTCIYRLQFLFLGVLYAYSLIVMWFFLSVFTY